MAALELAFGPATDDRHELLPCEVYQAWQAAFQEAGDAFRDWCAAPALGKAEPYAVYRAAADREDAAADLWLIT